MAQRRSARLSATSLVVDDDKKKANGVAADTPKATNGGRKRKTVAQEATETMIDGKLESPSTPKRKRVAKQVPPVTPTPSRMGLLSKPRSAANGTGRVNRLADPNATNAPLLSPETSRVITNQPVSQVSPSKLSNVQTTTDNILEEALAHLIKVEPKLKPVIETNHCRVFSPEGLSEKIDPFHSLSSGIISQQVSGAAAKSIQAKFVALFNRDNPDPATHVFPTPAQVVTSNVETIRTAGLSQRKAEYVLGLAEKFVSGELTTSMLHSASYEEVLEELIKVRGLGKWSVEMFACFGLKRMDVFSTGDLGVQRGMAAFVGKDVGKLKGNGKGKWKYMSESEMLEIAENFKPYR